VTSPLSSIDHGRMHADPVRGPAPSVVLPPLRDHLPLTPFARRWLLRSVMAVGAAAILAYFSWWLEDGHLRHPSLVLGAGVAAIYVAVQVVLAWRVYDAIEVTPLSPAPPGRSVDVLVPVFDEGPELVEAALQAALAIRYPHRTHLLDDTPDSRFAALAERLGVGYLTRDGHLDAKAGNVNAALARTSGEFVAIFDIDHLPAPDFLDAVLGGFDDPRVASVQSAVAFHNRDDSLVSRATIEQAYDIYGPTSMGMAGLGAAPIWGSHTTFRRAALEAIGGYQPGLAEDLHTSLRLHAAGWRTIFTPEVHASGLVPSDLRAFTAQQRKWSRGVFAMLFEVYPRVWKDLTWSQRIAYLVRCTYYLGGPLFAVHALLAVNVLAWGSQATVDAFASYLQRSVLLAVAVLGVRRLANDFWNVQTESLGFKWRGYTLAFALWPVATGGLVRAILRRPLPHIATPKRRTAQAHPRLVVAQVTVIVLLAGAILARITGPLGAGDAVVIAFAMATIAIQSYAVVAALRP
jgi:cellulose synthase (UDP-forming)